MFYVVSFVLLLHFLLLNLYSVLLFVILEIVKLIKWEMLLWQLGEIKISFILCYFRLIFILCCTVLDFKTSFQRMSFFNQTYFAE